MPHAVYLHSALTNSRVSCRDDPERRELLHFQRLDVIVALGGAGLANLAMVFVAVSLFSQAGRVGPGTIEAAHADLGRLVGGGAALAFAVALKVQGPRQAEALAHLRRLAEHRELTLLTGTGASGPVANIRSRRRLTTGEYPMRTCSSCASATGSWTPPSGSIR